MKKRIFSIMDTRRKKTGAAILCCVLVLTLATGMAFAANTNQKDSLEPQDISGSASPSAVTIGDATELTEEDIARSYEIYASFGLIRRDGELFYNGEAVRCFDDWYSLGEEMWADRSYFSDVGTVDVYAVRDFSETVYNPDGSVDPGGRLVGVKAYSQAEFDARDLSEYETEPAPPVAGTQSIQDSIRPYGRFGVSYDEKAGMMMYQGLPVREIYDEVTGILVSLTAGTGFPNGDIPENAVDLTPVYKNGVMTGLKKSTKEEFAARTRQRLNAISEVISIELLSEGAAQTNIIEDTAYVVTNLNSEYAQGRTIAEMFEDYVAFGVKFDTKSVNGGLGNIYFDGKLVKQFVDLQPDGGIFACSSSDGGEITIHTVYDDNGELTDVEIIKN